MVLLTSSFPTGRSTPVFPHPPSLPFHFLSAVALVDSNLKNIPGRADRKQTTSGADKQWLFKIGVAYQQTGGATCDLWKQKTIRISVNTRYCCFARIMRNTILSNILYIHPLFAKKMEHNQIHNNWKTKQPHAVVCLIQIVTNLVSKNRSRLHDACK